MLVGEDADIGSLFVLLFLIHCGRLWCWCFLFNMDVVIILCVPKTPSLILVICVDISGRNKNAIHFPENNFWKEKRNNRTLPAIF